MSSGPLSKRRAQAHLRVGVTASEWSRAWAALRVKAAEAGCTGELWLDGIMRVRGDWTFIVRTDDEKRHFGTLVEVVVEPSTSTKSKIVMSASRFRGWWTKAYRRCCGMYTPDGHHVNCTERKSR